MGEKKGLYVAYDPDGGLIMATDPYTLKQVPKVLELTVKEVEFPIAGVKRYKSLEDYRKEQEIARRAEGWEWTNH